MAIEARVEFLILKLGIDQHRGLAYPMLKGSAKIKNGEIVFRDDSGACVSEAEYVAELRKIVPEIFSHQGKATSKPQTGWLKNPYKSSTFNLTEQFKLERADPALAQALKLEAEKSNW